MKGATEARHQEAGRTYDFNPRTREGCDDDRTLDAVLAVGISIHAPVKGATVPDRRRQSICWHFNPRTREGCDYCFRSSWQPCALYFNPRTREGCDQAGSHAIRAEP